MTDLRNKPLPTSVRTPIGDTGSYRSIALRYSARSDEPLVKVKDFDIATSSHYFRSDGLNAPYFCSFESTVAEVWCRRAVAEKLGQVNESLAVYGFELLVLDAFRPVELQKALWEYFMNVASTKLESSNREECSVFARQYCADPTGFDAENSLTWPTHVTGGAVDLTLREINSGNSAFMGGIFDDPSELSHTAYYEGGIVAGHASASQQEAGRNRRLLFHAMSLTGFRNYPKEWWHFDWGTQMWYWLDAEKVELPWYGVATLSRQRLNDAGQ